MGVQFICSLSINLHFSVVHDNTMVTQLKKHSPLQLKLEALDYHSAGNVDVTNDCDLKALVIWLEDQKIRHYKIDDRSPLRDNTGDNWLTTFQQYCKDLKCPFNSDGQSVMEVADWLITVALKCEYSDEAVRVQSLKAGLSRPTPNGDASGRSPSSALDVDSSDEILQKGVNALARILQIGPHPDLAVLLAACRIVIQERLSTVAIENSKEKTESLKYFTATPRDCGFDFKDPVMAEAAKVLRLLHIEELRKLQTSINELIVEVQRLTANPKTDQSLGKVGR